MAAISAETEKRIAELQTMFPGDAFATESSNNSFQHQPELLQMRLSDFFVNQLVINTNTGTVSKVVRKGRPYGIPTIELDTGEVLQSGGDDREFPEYVEAPKTQTTIPQPERRVPLCAVCKRPLAADGWCNVCDASGPRTM